MQASFSTGAVVPFRESLRSLIGKKCGVLSGDGEGDDGSNDGDNDNREHGDVVSIMVVVMW